MLILFFAKDDIVATHLKRKQIIVFFLKSMLLWR